MAGTATPTAKASIDTTNLLLHLATEGEARLKDVASQFPEPAIALAWARGEIEFGQTKYVLTGNEVTAVTTHNGVPLPSPAVVIEGGIEWTGPKQRWHSPYHRIKADKLPVSRRYQKYQLEVCVNKEKDVWEWLEEGKSPGNRETRYARRDIERSEAESLFDYYVRLSDKGAAALAD